MGMAAEAAAAGPHNYRVSTWFFMCGPLAVNVFVLGLAVNLYVFRKHELSLHRVLDMRRHEVPTPGGVAAFAGLLFGVQLAIFSLEGWRHGDAFVADELRKEMLLLLYCATSAMLLLCPFDILHRSFRLFLVNRIGQCLWPFQGLSLQLPAQATPFVEVFIADGLTSLSKFIQDATVAFLLFALSFTSTAEVLRDAYISKLKTSPLPYLAASTPYIIRATQCIISFHRTTSANHRFMHLLNTFKYCSSLLVILVGAFPQIMGDARPDKSSLFLLCAVFNSLYSFLWDVIMDWGLGQPSLSRKRLFLRHQLLYKPRGVYYLIIVIDFALRILWVTKWWDWLHDGIEFKLISQVAEAIRRIIWNFIRVEWQCLKLDVLGTKKLSEDELELSASMETLQLTTEDEDNDLLGDDSDDSDDGNSDDRAGRAYRRATRGNSFTDDDKTAPPQHHINIATSLSPSRHSSYDDPISKASAAAEGALKPGFIAGTTHQRKASAPSFDAEADTTALLNGAAMSSGG